MQIFRLATVTLKFTKFLMSSLEPRVSFSSNFASLFSVMRHNSSTSLYTLDKRSPSKWKFSDFRLLANSLCYFSSHMSVFHWILHHPSVSWHRIPLKCSNWNICFRQKEPISVQFFRLLNALMKVHPIPHAIFETARSGFIQILYHCLVSWKITPLYFFSSNSIYFG